ncbi:unnamed protein product [Allacma fusca]|uniref:Uncharacterized protein n=1 Tax=Allacma fusca TaxID=39272 RepID=A0A8J2NJS4_9HEXA|nr:unnamed protein product [Allacma fusca]
MESRVTMGNLTHEKNRKRGVQLEQLMPVETSDDESNEATDTIETTVCNEVLISRAVNGSVVQRLAQDTGRS